MNIITKLAIKRITMWKDEYTVHNYVLDNLLFKILVSESRLDTKTTTTYIRNSLSNLSTCINDISDNILKFNTYVKDLVYSSHEYEERSSDLLINITKSYLTCENK